MKTLHFISLNNCYVSIHVVVRFAHAYRDFVTDNDYAIFIPIPDLFKGQRLKNVFLTLPCWGKDGSLTALKPTRKHLELSTGNKKYFIVTKRFHLMTARLSKDQRNQVIGVLIAGSTVNDIAHHYGCSRQTIYYLVNRYNKTGYVRVRCKTWSRTCDDVTSVSRYRVNSTM